MKISKDILHFETVSQIHSVMDIEGPVHPLISIIDAKDIYVPNENLGQRFKTNTFQISIKDSSCGLLYGRNKYDFENGVLVLTGPNQVSTPTEVINKGDIEGKMLIFHPDLILNTQLGKEINNYSFWAYDNHEALHLSEKEEKTILNLFLKIEEEINGNLDDFSQKLIVSNLSLILEYCGRYYNRQFITRSNSNKDIVSKFEGELKEYLETKVLIEDGLPTPQYLAEKVFLSQHYLSDLLKKETGRSIKDHINDLIIEKAKEILISSREPVSVVAYELGFNYPHYFSRLFKAKTGISPNEFRKVG
jgi:AraC-like DNA-binding protein